MVVENKNNMTEEEKRIMEERLKDKDFVNAMKRFNEIQKKQKAKENEVKQRPVTPSQQKTGFSRA